MVCCMCGQEQALRLCHVVYMEMDQEVQQHVTYRSCMLRDVMRLPPEVGGRE